MGLEAIPIKPLIGAEVEAGAQMLVDGGHARALRALLVERGVLVFRDLDITTAQQRAITATLGTLRIDAGDGLQKVTRDPKESPEYAAFFPTTFFWHMDGPFAQTTPMFGASLRPARLPSGGGGQTEFLNAFAAYETLPAEERKRIDGLRVVHTTLATRLIAEPDATGADVAAWRRVPPAVQPLVWEQEFGRRSLQLGNSVSHVENMHASESYDLLQRLRSHMSRPENVYRHEWRMGDMILWHNIGTMHRARPFDPDSRRLLNRFSLIGEEPIRGVSMEREPVIGGSHWTG